MYEDKIPQYLLEKINLQYGDKYTNSIIDGYKANRKVTLRVNTIKNSIENICKELEKNGIKYSIVPWSNEAIIIENKEEADIENLEIYKNGEIYLQSLSSMLPPIILNPQAGEDILDMAAAPGGKTTQIAALTLNKSCITACEMNALRAERLKYNIQKQGASSVNVMVTDARKLNNFFSFDKILLDAPCSGSGTINLNSDKEVIFTQKFEEKLEKTQIALLKKAVEVLKKGQEMVYSTCSILLKENENIIQKILDCNSIEIIPIDFNGIENIPQLPCKIKGALCVCPNELYEGFFVIKLRKIN